MIRFFATHPVLANCLFFLLLTMGIFQFYSMPVESFPNYDIGMVAIHTIWPGASPEEIEKSITTKIEEQLAEMENLLWIRSQSQYGLSKILVKFSEELTKNDYQRLYLEAQNKVRQVDDLPEDAELPRVQNVRVSLLRPTIILAIAGDIPEAARREIAEELKERLLLLPGMSKVSLFGKREKEVKIQLYPKELERYRLSILEIINLIEQENLSLPGGTFQLGHQEIIVRPDNQLDQLHELANLVVFSDGQGNVITLKEIAEISWGYEKWTEMGKAQGHRAIFLTCEKQDQKNTLDLIPEIKAMTQEFQSQLPPGVEIVFFRDSVLYLDRILSVLQSNLSLGLLLVFLILWLWIGLTNALLAVIGIPFSFLCSLIFLSFTGNTINEIVLISFVLVSGMVVDDAIVIIENIHRHWQEGSSLLEAACQGAQEVFAPVISSTATTVAAFLPMLIMTGVMGKVMSLVPKTVTYTLLASLIEAFLIMPGHYIDLSKFRGLSRWRHRSHTPKKLRPSWLQQAYLPVLKKCLLWRYQTVTFFLIIILTSLALMLHQRMIPVILFPSEHHDFWINIEATPGTSIESLSEQITPIEKILKQLPEEEILNFVVHLGQTVNEDYEFIHASNVAQFTVTLNPKRTTTRSTEQIMAEITQKIQNHPWQNMPSIQIIRIPIGPQQGRPVAVRVRGDNLTQLNEFSQIVKQKLQAIPGVFQIHDDQRQGKMEIYIDFSEQKLRYHLLTRNQVALTVAAAVEGLEASEINQSDDQVAIRVQFHPTAIQTLQDIQKFSLKTPNNDYIFLEDVASLSLRQRPHSINHYDQTRSITITANVNTDKNTSTNVNQTLLKQLAPYQRQYPNLTWTAGGEYEETNRSFQSLYQAFIIAVFLIYLILGTQFNSFLQPFLIMSIIPFSLVGILYGLWFLHLPFTMLTFISAVGLTGIVVNDSLVLIDFINNARPHHSHLTEAIIQASLKRVRPIMLTTLTTVLGLLPLALGLGGRSITWTPMATAFCWGLTFATVLTLFIIPALYLMLEDSKMVVSAKFVNLHKDERTAS